MLIEVTSIGDYAFLKELTSLGLEYDLLYSAPNVPARFCLG